MGSVNRSDCWYLYTVSLADCRLNSRTLALRNNKPKSQLENDQTLEILMTDLDEEKMRLYYQSNCTSAAEATRVNTPLEYIKSIIYWD